MKRDTTAIHDNTEKHNMKIQLEISTHGATEGYDRAHALRRTCAAYGEPNKGGRVRVSYDAHHNALLCPLCKTASTFWTRVFKMMDNNKRGRQTRHPFEVPISQAPASNSYFDIASQQVTPNLDATNSFRFLFVRNPFGMLFSAFVDKVVGPNPSYWHVYGSYLNAEKNSSHSCNDELTFEQFVNYVASFLDTKRRLDCHIAKVDECQPCKTNYTFVAKMETFKRDTYHILSKLNQTQTLEVFDDAFSALHADDAIEDSTNGPFSWRGGIVKCIPWFTALQRIWRKLQIRGVIGMQAFPLNNEEAETISKDDFIEILKKARRASSSEERSWQKVQSFSEAYRTVHIDTLGKIRRMYAREFTLFEYDDRPPEIFDRNEHFRNYGFLNYTNIRTGIMVSQTGT